MEYCVELFVVFVTRCLQQYFFFFLCSGSEKGTVVFFILLLWSVFGNERGAERKNQSNNCL